MELHTLSPGKGARRPRKRVGRGNASGSGRTAGRGEKGQKARSGGTVRAGFEGGQMPLYRRVPKVGFVSQKKVAGLNSYNIVNVSLLNAFENGATVDPEGLRRLGFGTKSRNRGGVKILGNGDLTKKLTVKAHSVSQAARAKIEAQGGTVEIIGPAALPKGAGAKAE